MVAVTCKSSEYGALSPYINNDVINSKILLSANGG